LQSGERSAETIANTARTQLEPSPFLKLDYLAVVDEETLQPVVTIQRPAVLAVAAFYGDVRLIDNIRLLPES